MKLPGRLGDCAVCPRLCRDVCPVAVHAFRDDFVPSEKMRDIAARLGHTGAVASDERLFACTDCGACTDHCLLSVPVASWLARAAARVRGAVSSFPQPPDAPAVSTLVAADLEPGALLLSTCDGDFEQAAERRTAGAPAAFPDTPALPRERADPGALLPDGHDHERVEPPLGSTCCGASLRAGIGDPDLRARMARAMVREVPDGARLVVCEARCGAHIQAAVGGRLRVVVLGEEGRR